MDLTTTGSPGTNADTIASNSDIFTDIIQPFSRRVGAIKSSTVQGCTPTTAGASEASSPTGGGTVSTASVEEDTGPGPDDFATPDPASIGGVLDLAVRGAEIPQWQPQCTLKAGSAGIPRACSKLGLQAVMQACGVHGWLSDRLACASRRMQCFGRPPVGGPGGGAPAGCKCPSLLCGLQKCAHADALALLYVTGVFAL